MKRKIIKQGHNTLTITLPIEWTKKFNLKGGDDIDLIERDDKLFISTEKIDDTKKTEFDISNMDIPTMWKHFMSAYREGYDIVTIRFSQDKIENPGKFFTQHALDYRYGKEREKRPTLESLQGFANRFIGFEIIEYGKNFIIIKDMGAPTNKEFDNSLRRVFLIIKQMSEDTMEAIKKNNPKILSDTHDIDINLDKFHDYCIRVLNKTNYKDSRKTSLLFSTLYLLELLGDEFKNIANHLLHDFPKAKLKNILELMEYVNKQINLYYDLFYKFGNEKIIQLSDLDKRSFAIFPKIYKKATEEEKEIFHHLRMVGRYINALLELRIEMEY